MNSIKIKDSKNYYVTDEGEVYRTLKNGEIKFLGSQHSSGYIYCSITNVDGSRDSKLVHRLVAEYFIPNPENLPVVDHIDEDKTNNKINNLRWCTQEQNSTYFNTKDGRDYHIKLRKEHEVKIKALLSQVESDKKELLRLKEELYKSGIKLAEEKEKFERYKVEEAKKIFVLKQNYQGYVDTKGMVFGSTEDMVQLVGKNIRVQGIDFPSCGAAASWITEQEANLGNIRNKDTISKELRRYLQGRKSEWDMYSKYSIGS